jgi:hypothetical protein
LYFGGIKKAQPEIKKPIVEIVSKNKIALKLVINILRISELK